MKKTNFDRYLEDQMQDPRFAARFERAGEAWDVALQIAALREQARLSQKQRAHRGRRVAEAAAPYRVKRASAKRSRRSAA